MVFFLVVLSLIVLLMVFLEPPLVLLLSLSVVFNESNPSPFLFCYVTDGFLPNGLGFPNVLLHVLDLTLVLLLPLSVTFGELNPPLPSFLCY